MPRGPRRRRQGFTPQERSEQQQQKQQNQKPIPNNYSKSAKETEKPKISGGLWTDDDILELIKLVKKFPGGTTDRWEKIADLMNRTVAEVTHMAKKVSFNYFQYFMFLIHHVFN